MKGAILLNTAGKTRGLNQDSPGQIRTCVHLKLTTVNSSDLQSNITSLKEAHNNSLTKGSSLLLTSVYISLLCSSTQSCNFIFMHNCPVMSPLIDYKLHEAKILPKVLHHCIACQNIMSYKYHLSNEGHEWLLENFLFLWLIEPTIQSLAREKFHKSSLIPSFPSAPGLSPSCVHFLLWPPLSSSFSFSPTSCCNFFPES